MKALVARQRTHLGLVVALLCVLTTAPVAVPRAAAVAEHVSGQVPAAVASAGTDRDVDPVGSPASVGSHGERRPVVALGSIVARTVRSRPPAAMPTTVDLTRQLAASVLTPTNANLSSSVVSAPQVVSSDSQSLVSSGGFAGLGDASNRSLGCSGQPCEEPPDPWVAVGPRDIVQSVNSFIRITSRSGTPELTVDTPTFFDVLPGQKTDSDPRVLFDVPHQRWIASYLSYDCTTGHLYLAASQTADPTGAWWRWHVEFPGRVPDYPALGVSTDKIVVSTNEYRIDPAAPDCIAQNNAYAGASMRVFDWADVLNGSLSVHRDLAANPDLFTWRPTVNLSSGTTVHAIVEMTDGGVGYATITGTNAGGDVTLSPIVTLPISLTVPPSPSQPGTPATIAAVRDQRPTDALWRNGSLWFVATGSCVYDAVRSCVYVRELSTNTKDTLGAPGTPTVRQTLKIGASGYDSYAGGIGLSQDGTLYIAFTRSSTTSAASSYATYRLLSDALGSVRPATLLKAGSGTYPGTRWGDYVGVAPDPTEPGSVWQANQYADGTSWATWVSRLSIEGPAATALAFVAPPLGAAAGSPLGGQPLVRLLDASGAPVRTGSTSNSTITLTLNPITGGDVLSCVGGLTRAAVAGLATFDGCSVTPAASSYTITASAPGLTPATSTPFNVVPPGTPLPAISLTATAATIAYGGTVTLSARLAVGPAMPSPGVRPMELQVSGDGVAWATIATLDTDGSGLASFVRRPTTNLTYRAIYGGATDLAPTASGTTVVRVRQIAVLGPTNKGVTRTVARRTTIAFTVLVRPIWATLPRATVIFTVYRRVGSSWQLYARRSLATDANGRATTSWTFTTGGSWFVRAMANATPDDLASPWTPIERYTVQ